MAAVAERHRLKAVDQTPAEKLGRLHWPFIVAVAPGALRGYDTR